jgi:phosphoglycolate phosphatase-like HAD superfamily hydrolase
MIEIIRNHWQRGRIRHAVFDFDGTLSLIREGWQPIMIAVMVDALLQTPSHESEPELRQMAADLVAWTTGQTTHYQMACLCQKVAKRGGQPLDPPTYKQHFLDRLNERIEQRLATLRAGRTTPDALMVPGARTLLETLRARGVQCYLVSGSDEWYVVKEAAALHITSYFDSIHGAQPDSVRPVKKEFIHGLVARHHLSESEFVSFGDGTAEIEEAVRAGGIAVGVASNEAERAGLDEHKRNLLIQVGAHIIVPDFREHEKLVAYLFDV